MVDVRDLWAFCDALTLLRKSDAMGDGDELLVRKWFRGLADYLRKRAGGAAASTGNVGIYHDLIVATIAAYANDTTTVSTVLTRASLRIRGHIGLTGKQELEALRASPLHASLFALQGLINLAWLGRNSGIDLWKYAGAAHRSIPMAARFVAVNRHQFSDYAASALRFDDRIEAALRAIPEDAADVEVITGLSRGAIAYPELLRAEDGFAPWWPILLSTDEEILASPWSPGRHATGAGANSRPLDTNALGDERGRRSRGMAL